MGAVARPAWAYLAGGSTIGELPKRVGVVVVCKEFGRTAPYVDPLAHTDRANSVWRSTLEAGSPPPTASASVR